MNNTESFLYLIVALTVIVAPLIFASPTFAPSEELSNEVIYGDCLVRDFTWKNDHLNEESELYGTEEHMTEMRCEKGVHIFTVRVTHEQPEWIRIDINLERFSVTHNPYSTPFLNGFVTNEKISFETYDPQLLFEGGTGFKKIDVKISSRETYKPSDILNDLGEDEALKFESEYNDKKLAQTFEFDGAKNAVKEFRKRIISLQEPNNENR